MKGDFTRLTFKPDKHYSGVPQQQGRVQLDADWNEQLEIEAHRDRTTATDVIGPTGAPIDHAGFGLRCAGGDLAGAGCHADAIRIGAGRYYVDGTLCENEAEVPIDGQPDLPGVGLAGTASNRHLAYLDVWQEHVTALEDEGIREVALGGPDTATRQRTVWQVRLEGPVSQPCSAFGPGWSPAGAAPTGTMAAQAEPTEQVTSDCLVPAGAGFRRLENQLYRVEIHKSGPAAASPANVTAADATYKWSRDNGSIVGRLEAIDPVTSIITVSHPNRDALSGFASGQWVELSDRGRVLRGEPGVLVELGVVQGGELAVKSWPGGTVLEMSDFGDQPTVRRWDSAGPLPVTTGQVLELEDGVQVQFSTGTYRSGDWWTIPARSLTRAVEWPADPSDPSKPAFLEPQGIEHRYAPIALLDLAGDGVTWKLASDCRRLFPPLTGVLSFTYLGGDGQETAPDLTVASPPPAGPLPEPLRVLVARGEHPVQGAPVRFAVEGGLGTVNGQPTVQVGTDSHGVAACQWALAPDVAHPVQHVVATLLDDTGQPGPLPPIRFTANLSLAARVAFDPRTKQCKTLSKAATVQDAIDTTASLTTLTYAGGDGQEARLGSGLPQLLQTLVSNGCGPLQGATVRFQAQGNGVVAPTVATLPGATSGTLDVTTGADGIASCAWRLDPGSPPSQQLTATLTAAGGNPTIAPTAVRFTANLSLATEVAYLPTCDLLKNANADTVQKALDVLCNAGGGGRDPGIPVVRVLLPATGAALHNDTPIAAPQLARGITINFGGGVDPIVQGKPVVAVTLDLPFPLSPPDQQFWQALNVGTVPATLSASLTQPAKDSIAWVPVPSTAAWLTGTLFQKVLIPQHIDQVLAHLVLKGNFIWAEGNETVNVDGEVFGTREGTVIDVKLPSGDGRRGGDLEMWFFLRSG